MHVQAAILRVIAREGTLRVGARVSEAAVLRPAWTGFCAEQRLTGHFRWLRMNDFFEVIAKSEELACPTQGNPHEVGIVADVSLLLGIERYNDTFHGRLWRRQAGANGAGKRWAEVRLSSVRRHNEAKE